MEILKDNTGKSSSKRVMGILLITTCIIIALVDQIFSKELNVMAFTSMLAAGTGLLGIGILEKK